MPKIETEAAAGNMPEIEIEAAAGNVPEVEAGADFAAAAGIEINADFKLAFELLEKTGRNVFITGRAGTGKSTFLQYFAANTKKKAVVLAPTGVAAVNVAGQTIHSFFALAPGCTVAEAKEEAQNRAKVELYRKLDIIIIDEISMVRADLLDCVDVFLKTVLHDARPFAGKQMLFIGDLYQLSPVLMQEERKAFAGQYSSEYFFGAKAMAGFDYTLIEFSKIYRQSDKKFIELLNRIRNKTATESDLAKINERAYAGEDDEGYIHLTTTNRMAEEINRKKLGRINEKPYSFRGLVEGRFEPASLPTELVLRLKKGAQIMFVANDSGRRWVNGTIGKIIKINSRLIIARTQNGRSVRVTPHAWEMFKYKFNPAKSAIEKEATGSFTQYPVKLAWAVTIHKSQGKTFSKVIVDIGSGTFTFGQLYVALSRCTALEGIKIKTPLRKSHIWLDWRIVKYLTQQQYSQSEKSFANKREMIEEAIGKKQRLEICYLKPDNEKSRRTITPIAIKQMEYLGHCFEGLEAYCHSRKGTRTFKIERILEIKAQ